jgi:murein L,D-transpeptidase YcbB/YkuD
MKFKNVLFNSLLLLSLAYKGTCQDLKLNFPLQAKALQEKNPEMIMNSTATILSVLQRSIYKGLDSSRYHISQLQEITGLSNTDSIGSLLMSDGLITYCRDLQISPLVTRNISYDEISGKYEQAEINNILYQLIQSKSVSELIQYIYSLEPNDQCYKLLLNELRLQTDSNHTKKIKALRLSIAYYRWVHHFTFEKCIVVNIPSATLTCLEECSRALDMKVVVGKPSTKTPRFAAYCNQVILYPYWHVPRSIAVNDILPACKKNSATPNIMNLQVLNSNGRIVDPLSINWKRYGKSDFPYTFRQATGCSNALGVIKFNITDPFNVYLHDTNFKMAFNSKKRFLSHGCIRVEKPIELANYILPQPIDEAFVKSCVQDQKPTVKSLSPVPVFVVYMLAEVDTWGNVIYYDDVYKLL